MRTYTAPEGLSEYDKFMSMPHVDGVFAWYKDYPAICCTAPNDLLAYKKLKEYRKAYLKLAKDHGE